MPHGQSSPRMPAPRPLSFCPCMYVSDCLPLSLGSSPRGYGISQSGPVTVGSPMSAIAATGLGKAPTSAFAPRPTLCDSGTCCYLALPTATAFLPVFPVHGDLNEENLQVPSEPRRVRKASKRGRDSDGNQQESESVSASAGLVRARASGRLVSVFTCVIVRRWTRVLSVFLGLCIRESPHSVTLESTDTNRRRRVSGGVCLALPVSASIPLITMPLVSAVLRSRRLRSSPRLTRS